MASKMFNLLAHWGFALLVLSMFVTSCKGQGDDDPFGIRQHLEMHRYKLNARKAIEDAFPEPRLALSAWGIIIVVVTIILAIVGMYYVSICYPVLCKKPEKYKGMSPPV